VKPGRPFETWTSTETGLPTAPFRVAEATAASMQGNGRGAWVPSAYMFPRRIDRTGVPQSGTYGLPLTKRHPRFPELTLAPEPTFLVRSPRRWYCQLPPDRAVDH
jgi:hypothetical protein